MYDPFTQPASHPETVDKTMSVSDLNQLARQILEQGLQTVQVRGEISNLSTPASGHVYFSLKDKNARVRCVMFAMNHRRLALRLEDGMLVDVNARVTLYEPGGQFQLVVTTLQPAGHGELQALFEARKRELAARGLFDSEHKKPLPTLPDTIGVITSATGAAIHDILHVLGRRFPMAKVRLYPTLVQGEAAKQTIVSAIRLAEREARADVLIIARGGGSIEDLWSFNETEVVEAIYRCSIPTISGVGHEVDITLVDYVADQRAPTPSAAAEQATPDTAQLLNNLQQRRGQLAQGMQFRIHQQQQRLTWLNARLEKQALGFSQWLQRLDYTQARMRQALKLCLERRRLRLGDMTQRLQACQPQQLLTEQRQRLTLTRARLGDTVTARLREQRQQLSALHRTLQAFSPYQTLERGYAIVQTAEGATMTSVEQCKPDDKLRIRLADGHIDAQAQDITGTQES